MGFNTAALILNDALDAIASDARIGDKILTGIHTTHRQSGDVTASGSHGTHIGAIKLLAPDHADYVQIVAVGGNCIRKLGGSLAWEPEDLLRDLAGQLGYSVQKKRARK